MDGQKNTRHTRGREPSLTRRGIVEITRRGKVGGERGVDLSLVVSVERSTHFPNKIFLDFARIAV